MLAPLVPVKRRWDHHGNLPSPSNNSHLRPQASGPAFCRHPRPRRSSQAAFTPPAG